MSTNRFSQIWRGVARGYFFPATWPIHSATGPSTGPPSSMAASAGDRAPGERGRNSGRRLAMAPRRRVRCAAIVSAPAAPHPVRQLALLALAELLAMTLWFSATAVLPALRLAWELSPTGAAWLTAAVQLGFVLGALRSPLFHLPPLFPPPPLLFLSALVGAAANL